MKKVVILGASGMLGHAVAAVLSKAQVELILTSRPASSDLLPRVGRHVSFDAMQDDIAKLGLGLGDGDYIINCIGIIKPHIHDDNEFERKSALLVNSLMPYKLSDYAAKVGARVIQIATDCVYSGSTGSYSESSPHDALDVYGKTKSLGEVPSSSMMHLRVSTIGPEQGRSTLLLEWVRNQPIGAQLNGFTDHLWNGVTTKAFGRIVRGILENNNFLPGTHHIVPADIVSKDVLVSAIARAFRRDDISVTPGKSQKSVDRTLRTDNPEFNEMLWDDAGYQQIPTIMDLLAEISA